MRIPEVMLHRPSVATEEMKGTREIDMEVVISLFDRCHFSLFRAGVQDSLVSLHHL